MAPAEVGRTAALAASLALGTVAWLQFLHLRSGSHAGNEGSAALHWVVDSMLALPVALLAVLVAGVLGERLRLGVRSGGQACSTALCAAVALGAGGVVHTLVSGTHSPPELALALHMLHDSLTALPVTLVICAVLVPAWTFSWPPALLTAKHAKCLRKPSNEGIE